MSSSYSGQKRLGGTRSNYGIAFSGGGAKMGDLSCVVSMAPSLSALATASTSLVFSWKRAPRPCGGIPRGITPEQHMWHLPWKIEYLY
jgi:hypothetical protein